MCIYGMVFGNKCHDVTLTSTTCTVWIGCIGIDAGGTWFIICTRLGGCFVLLEIILGMGLMIHTHYRRISLVTAMTTFHISKNSCMLESYLMGDGIG